MSYNIKDNAVDNRNLCRVLFCMCSKLHFQVAVLVFGRIFCFFLLLLFPSSNASPCLFLFFFCSYGGDISRKKKLLKKQAKGKKRMKQFGKVEVPQEAFMAVLQRESNTLGEE